LTGLSADRGAYLVRERHVLVPGALGNEGSASTLESTEFVGEDGFKTVTEGLAERIIVSAR
jgi:hypothetical protein